MVFLRVIAGPLCKNKGLDKLDAGPCEERGF